jgi:uncharacterized membrane protein YfhO
VTDEPERIVITNPLHKTGVLMLRDACYPGWVAHADGTELPITCADILFRQIHLPNAANEIVFAYAPQSVRIGLALSGVGLLVWWVLALWAHLPQQAIRSRLLRGLFTPL